MSDRWSAADIPDQHGRIAVITGGNTGLGFETAKALAARGATVVLAARDPDKGTAAAARITETTPDADVIPRRLDLASLSSIRETAEQLRSSHERIDLLINNAGVMYTPQGRTSDGFETQFGINHLGHFALTGLLLDRMLGTPGSRVVTVSSGGHRIQARMHFDDLILERGYSRVAAYGRSKLANLLFTYELQRRLAPLGSTAALAAHPGASRTELGRHLPTPMRALERLTPAQPASMGALPTLRAATDPSAQGGQYYGPDGLFEMRGHPTVVRSSARSHEVELQRRLWAVSEELTGVRFPPL